jgi:hypothetical protein
MTMKIYLAILLKLLKMGKLLVALAGSGLKANQKLQWTLSSGAFCCAKLYALSLTASCPLGTPLRH